MDINLTRADAMPAPSQRKDPQDIPLTGRLPLMNFRFSRQTRLELEAIIPGVSAEHATPPTAAATLVRLIHLEYVRQQEAKRTRRKAP